MEREHKDFENRYLLRKKLRKEREFLKEDRRKSRKRSINTKWRMGGIS